MIYAATSTGHRNIMGSLLLWGEHWWIICYRGSFAYWVRLCIIAWDWIIEMCHCLKYFTQTMCILQELKLCIIKNSQWYCVIRADGWSEDLTCNHIVQPSQIHWNAELRNSIGECIIYVSVGVCVCAGVCVRLCVFVFICVCIQDAHGETFALTKPCWQYGWD